MRIAIQVVSRLIRTLSIVALVAVGSTILVRFAPGYLSDAREMDARYRTTTQAELSLEAAHSSSLVQMLTQEFRGWVHGDFGISRQYEVPVAEMILPRLAVTGSLIFRATILAWTLALGASLLSSVRRKPSLLWNGPATLLLAVPTAAMATVCLLVDSGGPLLVMTFLLSARDYKFLDRILRKTWREPHVLLARAQGISAPRLLWVYIFPSIKFELLALATLSVVTGLSALIPVEVLFSVPGIGQLAWNAAMNRDLPMLLAVTMLMALAVTVAGMLSGRQAEWETA